MTDTLDTKWCILRRENGHALPPIGNTIPLHNSEDEARADAKAMSDKFAGTKFAVCLIVAEYTAEVQTIVREIPNRGQS